MTNESTVRTKPTIKKRPRAQQKPTSTSPSFEPVPGVEGQKIGISSGTCALPREALVRTFHVLYRLPRNAQLKLTDNRPERISVPIGQTSILNITGDPELLGAVNIAKGDAVQGKLTVTRSPLFPHRVISVDFVAISSLAEPRLQLRTFANFIENYSIGKGEQGTVIRINDFILKLVVTKPVATAEEKLAA